MFPAYFKLLRVTEIPSPWILKSRRQSNFIRFVHKIYRSNASRFHSQFNCSFNHKKFISHDRNFENPKKQEETKGTERSNFVESRS